MEKSISSSFEISKLPDTSQPVVNTTNVSIGSNFSRNMPVDDYNFDEDLTIAHEKEMDLCIAGIRSRAFGSGRLHRCIRETAFPGKGEKRADPCRLRRRQHHVRIPPAQTAAKELSGPAW